MGISQLSDISKDVVEGINRLLLQLNPDSQNISSDRLSEIINSPTIMVFVAREGESIVGMATLLICNLTSGVRAQVEDVVVDRNHRGKKIGEKLVQHIIEQTLLRGIRKIDLTSKPARIAANKLYQKIGFKVRETNVYRLDV